MTNAGKNLKPQRTQRYTNENLPQKMFVNSIRLDFPLCTFVSSVVDAFDSK
jgi:hypothetical protein